MKDRKDDRKECPDECRPGDRATGPVREAGGTTGAGNLSPQGASRTGGATGGVEGEDAKPRPSVPPSA